MINEEIAKPSSNSYTYRGGMAERLLCVSSLDTSFSDINMLILGRHHSRNEFRVQLD
jgi:hypothetical protein